MGLFEELLELLLATELLLYDLLQLGGDLAIRERDPAVVRLAAHPARQQHIGHRRVVQRRVGGIGRRRDLLGPLPGGRLLQRGLELRCRDVAVRRVLDHGDVPRGHARMADPVRNPVDRE